MLFHFFPLKIVVFPLETVRFRQIEPEEAKHFIRERIGGTWAHGSHHFVRFCVNFPPESCTPVFHLRVACIRTGPEFDTDKEVSDALRMALENLDGEDAGQTLSEEELAAKQKSLTVLLAAPGTARALSVASQCSARASSRRPLGKGDFHL